MNISIVSITKYSLLIGALVFGCIYPSLAKDIQKFSNVHLVNNPANDGDSFHVDAAGRRIHVRLYFVDCPETSVGSKSDAQRVREQTRYFGLSSADRAIHFGNEAKSFVAGNLSKPFILYTSFASALGRSSKGRVYGFILTSDGNDLASVLVKNGFARTYGIGRKTPNGISRDEMVERLKDLEISAMLKRIGIWSESNPDRIAELRAKQRSEEAELQELVNQIKKTKGPQRLLDINTATKNELQSIKGIGPVLAERIISGRPYKTIDDLLKVKGIGLKTLQKIRTYLVVADKIGKSDD